MGNIYVIYTRYGDRILIISFRWGVVYLVHMLFGVLCSGVCVQLGLVSSLIV